MVDIQNNGLLLADNLISLLIWLSAWSLVDLTIQRYSKTDKHLYIWYVGVFILGMILLLLLGYPSQNIKIQDATPIHSQKTN
jgi:hypothetical protein